MSNSLIEVNNLKKTFGGLTAVDIKQLGFNKGQLTSIIGPNGAGKTTFFDLITDLNKESLLISDPEKSKFSKTVILSKTFVS